MPDPAPRYHEPVDADPPTAAPPAPAARGRRLRLGTISGLLLLHALALAVWTGTWITGHVQESPLAVPGEIAAPALPALALSGLALGAALTISGPFFRVVLAVLQLLLGVSIALNGVLVLADPSSAAAPAVTALTGISGHDGVAELLRNAAPTAMPFLAIAVGAASAGFGVLLAVTSRRWPGRSSRFGAVRAAGVQPAGSYGEWDALSGGVDPTAADEDSAAEHSAAQTAAEDPAAEEPGARPDAPGRRDSDTAG
jgi:hypothetical protein